MECFNCKQPGHIAAECRWTELSQHDPMSIYRRPAWEISTRAREWVDEIFAAQGWVRGVGKFTRWRNPEEIAAEQVAEARAARTVLP